MVGYKCWCIAATKVEHLNSFLLFHFSLSLVLSFSFSLLLHAFVCRQYWLHIDTLSQCGGEWSTNVNANERKIYLKNCFDENVLHVMQNTIQSGQSVVKLDFIISQWIYSLREEIEEKKQQQQQQLYKTSCKTILFVVNVDFIFSLFLFFLLVARLSVSSTQKCPDKLSTLFVSLVACIVFISFYYLCVCVCAPCCCISHRL